MNIEDTTKDEENDEEDREMSRWLKENGAVWQLGLPNTKAKKRQQKDPQPGRQAKKRKLEGWGETPPEEEIDIRSWLLADERVKEVRSGECSLLEEKPSSRLRQLEITFSRVLTGPERGDQEETNTEESIGKEEKQLLEPKKKRTKKEKLEEAARGCMKMTSWLAPTRSIQEREDDRLWEDVPDPINPDTIVRLELAKSMSRRWANKSMIKELVDDLVMETVPRAEAGRIVMTVVDRAWSRVKELEVWKWLEDDPGLQKTTARKIEWKSLELRRKEEEVKKEERLVRKREKENIWKGRRNALKERQPMRMESDSDSMMGNLGECMRSLALSVGQEGVGEGWKKWTSQEDEVMEEIVEHAFLDFMEIDLGMETKMTETPGFEEDEEMAAHVELDLLLDSLEPSRKNEDRMETEDEVIDVDDDKCDKTAYCGQGPWLLDRWLRKKNVPLPSTRSGGRGGK